MSDETFHLTPHDVRAQEFGHTWRGYDRLQVEDFQTRVAEELEKAMRDRVQAEERLRNAQEQLRGYRERERAMNEALIAAQLLRTEAQQAAQREAESIIREAKHEGKRLVEDAESEAREARARGEAAARQFAAYVAGFRGLLERQRAELDVLEGHSREIVRVQAAALVEAERSE